MSFKFEVQSHRHQAAFFGNPSQPRRLAPLMSKAFDEQAHLMLS